MKKLLPIILAAVMLLAALTACSEPSNIDATEIPSQEPSAQVTQNAQQTEVPTEEPTEEPVLSYNEYECDVLRRFFDEESGAKNYSNGKLLNPEYVSEDPSTWASGESPIIKWTEDGHVEEIIIWNYRSNKRASDKPLALCGSLEIINFPMLTDLQIGSVAFDSIIVKDCPNLHGFVPRFSCIDNVDIEIEDYSCDSGCFNSTECESVRWSCASNTYINDFSIDITVSSSSTYLGYVQLSVFPDDHYYSFVLSTRSQYPYAEKFIGWFDENGNLISTEQQIDLTRTVDGDVVYPSGKLTYRAVYERS